MLGPVSSCVWWGEAPDAFIVVLSEGAPSKYFTPCDPKWPFRLSLWGPWGPTPAWWVFESHDGLCLGPRFTPGAAQALPVGAFGVKAEGHR